MPHRRIEFHLCPGRYAFAIEEYKVSCQLRCFRKAHFKFFGHRLHFSDLRPGVLPIIARGLPVCIRHSSTNITVPECRAKLEHTVQCCLSAVFRHIRPVEFGRLLG